MVAFAIHWHESATGVHVSPISKSLPAPFPSHPSGVSQCTGFACSVSCIELGLVIYFVYGSIPVSMLFSQIIWPSPSPRVRKSLLYICVSFAFLHIGSSLPSFYIPYICINILYRCFSFWLTSLCIIGMLKLLIHC